LAISRKFFTGGTFQALRFLRAFLGVEPFAAHAIAKSPNFLPPFIAATNHLGLRPRPAQVSAEFSGLRYLGATAPLGPPRLDGRPRRGPPAYSSSFDNSASSSCRRYCSFSLIAASTCAQRSCSLTIGIDFKAMVLPFHLGLVAPIRGSYWACTDRDKNSRLSPHAAAERQRNAVATIMLN
jgi:hypothetical protein